MFLTDTNNNNSRPKYILSLKRAGFNISAALKNVINKLIIMKTRITTLLSFLILSASTLYGQGLEPLDIAKKIFDSNNTATMDEYCTGEYKGQPNGHDIQTGTITKFRLLEQTQNKAVINMTILDSAEAGLDTYLFFEKKDTWKMSAFRALAMTGIIEKMESELEKLTPQQVEDIIRKSKESKSGEFKMFTSKEDYDFQLGNAKLILELDDNIIKHFESNRLEFERLKDLALKEREANKTDGERHIKLLEHLEKDYHKLFISSVSLGNYEVGSNGINFLIGGMLDNTVGYLYVKDKKDLPQMNPSRIIMIREIGGGWYIYKTT